jgi:hypothetical protein
MLGHIHLMARGGVPPCQLHLAFKSRSGGQSRAEDKNAENLEGGARRGYVSTPLHHPLLRARASHPPTLPPTLPSSLLAILVRDGHCVYARPPASSARLQFALSLSLSLSLSLAQRRTFSRRDVFRQAALAGRRIYTEKKAGASIERGARIIPDCESAWLSWPPGKLTETRKIEPSFIREWSVRPPLFWRVVAVPWRIMRCLRSLLHSFMPSATFPHNCAPARMAAMDTSSSALVSRSLRAGGVFTNFNQV